MNRYFQRFENPHHPNFKLPLGFAEGRDAAEALVLPCLKLLILAEGSIAIRRGEARSLVSAPSLIWLDDDADIQSEGSREFSAVLFLPEMVNDALTIESLRTGSLKGLPLSSQLDLFWVEPFLRRGSPVAVPLSPTMEQAIRQRLTRLRREIGELRAPYWPCRTRSELIELLFLAGHIFTGQRESPVREGQLPPLVEQVLLALQTRYPEPLTIDSLAKEFATNRTTLQAQFSKAMGRTLAAYLRELRLFTAKTLLTETTLPIDRIAERVGYTDPSHFSRVFKEAIHFTPAAFRREFRAQR
jgi:AraC-like DNA-binding protein